MLGHFLLSVSKEEDEISNQELRTQKWNSAAIAEKQDFKDWHILCLHKTAFNQQLLDAVVMGHDACSIHVLRHALYMIK